MRLKKSIESNDMSDDAVNTVVEQDADHGCQREGEDKRKCFDGNDGHFRCKEYNTNIDGNGSEAGVSSAVSTGVSDFYDSGTNCERLSKRKFFDNEKYKPVSKVDFITPASPLFVLLKSRRPTADNTDHTKSSQKPIRTLKTHKTRSGY